MIASRMQDCPYGRRRHRPVQTSSPGHRMPGFNVPLWLCAMLLAVLVCAAPPSAGAGPKDVVAPTADRLWGGCQLDTNTAIALGQPDFVVVYSLQTNAGQPLKTTPKQYTGPVVCANSGASIKSYTDATRLPNSDTGGSSIVLLSVEKLRVVLFDPSVDAFDCRTTTPNSCNMRICDSVACYFVQPGAASSGCSGGTLSTDGLRAAIAKGLGIDDTGIQIAFVLAFNIGTSSAPTIGTATGYASCQQDSQAPISSQVDILATQQADILRYQVNFNGGSSKVEQRLSHTANQKTDAFRIYK